LLEAACITLALEKQASEGSRSGLEVSQEPFLLAEGAFQLATLRFTPLEPLLALLL
jgi:hypothetical protein